MALLYVLDDGDDAGEILRVRAHSFVIGRVEGELVIPHDSGISGRHAEISRRFENGAHYWYLKDLQSTNGTFVRAATITLSHDQEFLIGSRRLRFEAPVPPSSPAQPTGSESNATRKWEVIPGSQPVAALRSTLVDISPVNAGLRFLSRRENTGLAATRPDRPSSLTTRWPIAGTPGSIATTRTAGSWPTIGRGTGSGRASRRLGSVAAGSSSAVNSGFFSRSSDA